MVKMDDTKKTNCQQAGQFSTPNTHFPMRFIPLFLLLLLPPALVAQQLDYTTYIQRVMENNLDLAVARLDRSVAEAELLSARQISDPAISAEYGNNSDWDILMGQSLSFGIDKSFSLGKRAARVRVARQQLDATDAALQHYLNTLRAEATLAFLDALLARDRAAIGEQSAQYMRSLYRSDSLRHAAGDMSELDVLQTLLEADVAEQDYLSLLADYRNALVQLDLLMAQPLQTTVGVTGGLADPSAVFSLPQLLAGADTLRMDLAEHRLMAAAAESQVSLVRRERMPDIDLSLGVSLNTRVRNEEAPAPPFVGYTVGVGIPLPVSTLNRGEVRAAKLQARQAQLQADIVGRQAQAEIIQAYNSYTTALGRLRSYDASIIEGARQVLEGKQYAYHRGETSLLDLINAQHTYNEVRQAYAESLHDCMSAWVELQRSAGVWNIQL